MSLRQNREEQKEKRRVLLHSLYDYSMGILWLGLGTFFLMNKKLDVDWMNSDPLLDGIFGGVGIAYGLFRIYRGYQQKNIRR